MPCCRPMTLAPVHLSNPSVARLAWIALLLLQLAGFTTFLARSRYLPGTDAYYYALQSQSLLDTGHLKVPDGDTVPYLVAALARLGLSIEASFKTVLVAIYGLYGIGFLLLASRLKIA